MFIVFLGIILSMIAATMAFLITFSEYEKHFPEQRGKIWKMAFESAAVFFLFFTAITVTIAFVFGILHYL